MWLSCRTTHYKKRQVWHFQVSVLQSVNLGLGLIASQWYSILGESRSSSILWILNRVHMVKIPYWNVVWIGELGPNSTLAARSRLHLGRQSSCSSSVLAYTRRRQAQDSGWCILRFHSLFRFYVFPNPSTGTIISCDFTFALPSNSQSAVSWPTRAIHISTCEFVLTWWPLNEKYPHLS